jgi:DNA polymerase-3 subunit delta
MAIAEFDGPAAELADVLDECRTMSLLASVRLVCVRDADAFVAEYREALEKYLQSPSPTGVLVLVCTRWDKRWRLYKLVETIGRNVDCQSPVRAKIPPWLIERARHEYGCELQAAAAQRLIELTGQELGRLDMDLAKLATYVHPRQVIRPTDVDELVGATRAEKVFGITDAIGRRDAARALALWAQVLASDPDASYRAVGGLAYGFRKLAAAKRLLEQGKSPVEAAKMTGVYAPAAELKRQLDRFSLGQWEQHLVELLQIDVAAKTGSGTVQSAVEKFIVELCAAS